MGVSEYLGEQAEHDYSKKMWHYWNHKYKTEKHTVILTPNPNPVTLRLTLTLI